jgi:hypothetical protein
MVDGWCVNKQGQAATVGQQTGALCCCQFAIHPLCCCPQLQACQPPTVAHLKMKGRALRAATHWRAARRPPELALPPQLHPCRLYARHVIQPQVAQQRLSA